MAKIKNVFGEPWKEVYADIRISPKATSLSGMACSHNKIAFPWDVTSGGLIGVINLDKYGKKLPILKLKGHKGGIQDLEFNYFNFNILATASDDATILIWEVPDFEDSLEVSNPIATLTGHTRKVISATWNPVADFILASGSADSFVNIWNVTAESKLNSIKVNGNISNLKWHSNGNLLVVACKEGNITIVDPRNQKNTEFLAHESSKATIVTSLEGPAGDLNYVLTTGFLGNQVRQVKLWDLRKTDNFAKEIVLDSSPSPLLPYFDDNLGILTLTAKGDSTVRCFGFSSGDLVKNGELKSKTSIKSFAWAPKIVCNQEKCELARFFVNEEFKLIQPISLLVSRRNAEGHAELYPQIASFNPSLSSYEWTQGKKGERQSVPHLPSVGVLGTFCKFKKSATQKGTQSPTKTVTSTKPAATSNTPGSVSTQASEGRLETSPSASIEFVKNNLRKTSIQNTYVPPPVSTAPTSTLVHSATRNDNLGGPNVHRELANLLAEVSKKLILLDQKIQKEIDASNIRAELKNVVGVINNYLK